jgi:hypothetical protein
LTAQISDIYKHKRKKYNLVAMSEPMCFEPEDYGLKPESCITCCWRGYWCEYKITDDGLVLDKLYIYNSDGFYPDLNGVPVSPAEFEDHKVSTKDGEMIKSYPKHLGHRLYKNINMSIPYTGKILLGDKFLHDYYIHMGFQRPFAYKILMEFVFEKGKLIETIDHSDKAKKMREIVDLDEYVDRKNTIKYIDNSFSLDYNTKAWWLNEI